MTDNEANAPETTQEPAPVPRRRGASKTPFDYPLVFPGLLFVLGLWFGYDGWFNPKTKAVMFNQVLFVIFAIGFVWTLRVDLLELKQIRAKKEAAENGDAEEAKA